MASSLTVKLTRRTHERLRRLAGERRLTVDQVIQAGLDAMERDEERQRVYQQALDVANDPADLVEIRAIPEDLAATSAG